MAYEQRDNSGTVFVNDRKEKDTHPDRTGTAMIDGVMYYVSGWIKDGAKGKFLSLAFKRKEDQPIAARSAPTGDLISQRATPKGPARPDPRISVGVRNDDMSDDIPF